MINIRAIWLHFVTAAILFTASKADAVNTLTLPEVPVAYEEEELILSFLLYIHPLEINNGLLVEAVESPPSWYEAFKANLRPDTFDEFSEWRKHFTEFPGEGFGIKDEQAFAQSTASTIESLQSPDGPEDARLQKQTVLHEIHVRNPNTGEKFLFLITWRGEKDSLPMTFSEAGGYFATPFRWSEQKRQYEYILPDSGLVTDAAVKAYLAGGEQVVADANLADIMANYEGKEAEVMATALDALRNCQ